MAPPTGVAALDKGAGAETAAAEVASLGDGKPPGGGRFRRRLHLALPVILSALAVGVHWVIDVPPGPIKSSPKDQGAKDKDKKKKKGFEPRAEGELQASWERYESVDFDAEPVKSAWARPQQSLINKAVALARKRAFAGAPEEPRITVESVECRTIRCRFILHSPFSHEIDLLGGLLQQMQAESATIWRHYQTETIAAPAGKPKGDTYVRVVVVFVRDGIDASALELPGDKEAERDRALIGGAAPETDGDDAPAPADNPTQ